MRFTLEIELGEGMRTAYDVRRAILASMCRIQGEDVLIPSPDNVILSQQLRAVGKWEVTETPAADPLETLCECGREPSDCATSAGADYHADRDDFIAYGEPKTYEEFARLNGDEDEDAPEPDLYSVIVGNVGTVYAGDEPHEAKRHYAAYVELSRGTTGRAAGEPVTLMKDGEPIQEHQPATEEDGDD